MKYKKAWWNFSSNFYLDSSSSTEWAGLELANISMLLWNALDRVLGTGKSEMDVIWDSSDTLLLATTALLSANTSGSSTLDLTIRSCFRDLGRDPYRDWLKLVVDWLFILIQLYTHIINDKNEIFVLLVFKFFLSLRWSQRLLLFQHILNNFRDWDFRQWRDLRKLIDRLWLDYFSSRCLNFRILTLSFH